MRKPMVAGNWKMNASTSQVEALLSDIKQRSYACDGVALLVCPPFPYLAQTKYLLSGSDVKLGAQNVSEHESGAYTGEVSTQMLNDFACEFVIIGHSERRHLYGETNEQVAAKCSAAFKAGLCPILCVGETLEQREAGQTMQVINQQLAVVLAMNDNLAHFNKAIIAYEPVWAIGTGKTATPEQAQEVHAAIREQLASCGDAQLAPSVRILYGGSVKPDNAAELFSMTDIDGGLIGGASLDATSFIDIARCAVSKPVTGGV